MSVLVTHAELGLVLRLVHLGLVAELAGVVELEAGHGHVLAPLGGFDADVLRIAGQVVAGLAFINLRNPVRQTATSLQGNFSLHLAQQH